MASLGDRDWEPLPRPLPYGGLPPEPPVTILLHLLSEDDPRLSLDMDDTYWSEHESHRELHALLATKVSNHPKSWAEASRRHDASLWRQACDSELASLEATSTWDLVPYSEVPPGRRVLPVRWVFTIKGDGRYKARLVVLGCLQTKADFDDIFAPVIRLECLRALLVLACLRGYEVHGMDVKTAFLNAEIDVEIFI